jgi:hypothetical protein
MFFCVIRAIAKFIINNSNINNEGRRTEKWEMLETIRKWSDRRRGEEEKNRRENGRTEVERMKEGKSYMLRPQVLFILGGPWSLAVLSQILISTFQIFQLLWVFR